jgi:hypothetical protein
MAKALQAAECAKWQALDDNYDSMEEVDESEFVTYKDPVGIKDNNAKNADGSYQLCSHGYPLRPHVDKSTIFYSKGNTMHYENHLATFKEIARAGVEVDEAVLSCDATFRNGKWPGKRQRILTV